MRGRRPRRRAKAPAGLAAATKDQTVLPELEWSWPTRFVFFTGKGGVGKTTIAAAGALALADRGKRVLVVSTDPASNLDDVFAASIGSAPTAVPGADLLWAQNIDPEAAVAGYRERVVAPYRGAVPDEELQALEEQLAGQCTVEIAAFDEFARLLSDPDSTASFDHVFFDTAPTGHTLRLLSLPSAWSGYIETSPAGASCLGPLAGLEAKQEQYEATAVALADPAQTTVVLVARADPRALAEAARAGAELAALAIRNQRLVVNAVLEAPLAGDRVAEDMALRQRQALAAMPPTLADLQAAAVPMIASDLTGLEALRALSRQETRRLRRLQHSRVRPPATCRRSSRWLASSRPSGHGVVLVMGKGGVGKTTIAIEVALGLARLGHPVHLSTTDPAGDPAAIVGPAPPRGVTVSRIDPESRGPQLHPAQARGSPRARSRQARPARGGSALAVHARDRGLHRILAAAQRGARPLRRARHRANRAHAAAARHDRRLPPRRHAHIYARRSPDQDATDASPRSCLHPRADSDAGRGDARAGGCSAPGRPSPCRHRAVRLGRQRDPERQRHARPPPTAPSKPRAAPPAAHPRTARNTRLARPLARTRRRRSWSFFATKPGLTPRGVRSPRPHEPSP